MPALRSSASGRSIQVVPVAELVSDFGQMGLELTEEGVSEGLEADRNDTGDEHLNNDSTVSYVLTQSHHHVVH